MNGPRAWAEELQEEDLQTLTAVRMLLASAIRSGSRDELESAAEISLDQLREEISRLRGLIARMRSDSERLDSAPL